MCAPSGRWYLPNLSRLDWATVSDVVEFPIMSAADTLHVTDGPGTLSLQARRVTYGVVAGLQFRRVAGRPLVEDDFRAGCDPVVLIGHHVWRDRFGASPGAVGQQFVTETQAG